MASIVWKKNLRFLVLSGALGASIVACAADGASAAAPGTEHAEEALGDPRASQPPPPKRPPTCKSEQDCSKGCPPGSRGCTCHALPHGPSVCVPTCAADGDCPAIPGVPPLSCRDGICAPPPPPPRPAACETEQDCVSACPPGASGCTCRPLPEIDTVCVPVCTTDADCPSLPAGPPLTCHDGACAPPPPPRPPAG